MPTEAARNGRVSRLSFAIDASQASNCQQGIALSYLASDFTQFS